MFKKIKMLLQLIVVAVVSVLLWRHLFVFYVPNQQTVIDKRLFNLPFSVAIYNNEYDEDNDDNVMIHIMPQNVYMFLENSLLLYQPTDYGTATTRCSSTHPALAFIMPLDESTPPQPICRRALPYLTQNVYTRLQYQHLFARLHNPMWIIQKLLRKRIIRLHSIT